MVTVVPAQHHLGEYSRDVDLAASSEGSIPRASHKTIGMGPASHPQAAGASCGGGEKGEMETEGSKRERERRIQNSASSWTAHSVSFTTFHHHIILKVRPSVHLRLKGRGISLHPLN